MTPKSCPFCNKDFTSKVGEVEFSSVIGIEIPEIYDGIYLWKCPECGRRFENEAQRT